MFHKQYTTVHLMIRACFCHTISIFYILLTYIITYKLTNYLHCPNTARDCGIGRNGETPLQTDPLTLTASPFVSVSVECTRVVDVDG